MPLTVTVELSSPNPSKKRPLAIIRIENDGSLDKDFGSYKVRASVERNKRPLTEFADFTIGPIKRGDVLDTVIEILNVLHSSKLPADGELKGSITLSDSATRDSQR
jgi:hypothetical protein